MLSLEHESVKRKDTLLLGADALLDDLDAVDVGEGESNLGPRQCHPNACGN